MNEQSRAADAVRTQVGPGLGLARVVGAGHAVPAAVGQQELWEDFFDAHWAGNPLARKIWSMTGIETRHFVIDPRTEQDAVEWGTGARMRRYLDEAMPLGETAIKQALEQSGIAAEEIGLFAVVSCTGYVTPGLDILLAQDLGMSPDVQRLLIGHMGCYAAMPGLAAVSDYVQSRGRPAVLLCLELTSLHGQLATETIRSGQQTYDDVQQIVAHALFSDAASAVVVAPETAAGAEVSLPGFEVRDFVSRTDPDSTEHMAWEVTDQGFKMMLSPQVPAVLEVHVERVVRDLLGRNGLTLDDVAGWAVHPGGRRILEVVEEKLDLGERAMAPSYEVLRDYGNCSSATVLLVVEKLLADSSIAAGDHVVAMAFGPGLTLYASLLRRR